MSTATWCSTCKATGAAGGSPLLKEPKFKELVLLHVDFDKQKAVPGANSMCREQSTFVVFKGGTEVGRSTGDTDKASIEKLFEKAS